MFGIVFFVEVIRGECGRFDGFDVPRVKIFVGEKSEQCGVGIVGIGHTVRRKAVAIGEQCGAVGVFQTAVNMVADVEQEQIFLKWGRGGEHRQFCFADF